ncbi:protoporphyrinogen oxidase [Helicocarpus griseus UAMH5409]|uniref:Protoporphyrinogen oxidase n=1 Tax=Helicocarpus griseus UAMH5409 TaxID=1447875 RepID=A0A2B7XDW1_9EURO|nr:protoporphyrinogen oxidase [Helicocarpus griseus UAMH5409]
MRMREVDIESELVESRVHLRSGVTSPPLLQHSHQPRVPHQLTPDQDAPIAMRPGRLYCRNAGKLWAHSRPKTQPLALSKLSSPTLPRCIRRFSSSPISQQKNIAVIGAGITGLSTAYRLSQDQDANVTLYEKSSNFGGWLQSEVINVDGGDVVFEYGPRTLRAGLPASLSTLELLSDLGLEDAILAIRRDSPAACNRYIYYPDHLVRLPGPYPGRSRLVSIFKNFLQLRSEPIIREAAMEWFSGGQGAKRDPSIKDESVASLCSRVFGPNAANVIASAVFHGIYAGDVNQLSARAIAPVLWELDVSDQGVLMGMWQHRGGHRSYDIEQAHKIFGSRKGKPGISKETFRVGMGASVLTLRGGLGQLAATLESNLRNAPNVKLKTNSDIKYISQEEKHLPMTLALADGTTNTHDYIISTTSPAALGQQLVESGKDLPSNFTKSLTKAHHAVSVMVVNLYYTNPSLLSHQGFGYLIPAVIPYEQNPERALGVLFASESSVGQDTAPGTKLTVMLGGHWWDDWQESDLPDEESAIAMAKTVIGRHLHVADEPVVARARLQRKAIPQPTIGYVDRMEELHAGLGEQFGGRVKVAGAWYTGVGVNDCIRAGRILAAKTLSGEEGVTGLEMYLPENFKRVKTLKEGEAR